MGGIWYTVYSMYKYFCIFVSVYLIFPIPTIPRKRQRKRERGKRVVLVRATWNSVSKIVSVQYFVFEVLPRPLGINTVGRVFLGSIKHKT